MRFNYSNNIRFGLLLVFGFLSTTYGLSQANGETETVVESNSTEEVETEAEETEEVETASSTPPTDDPAPVVETRVISLTSKSQLKETVTKLFHNYKSDFKKVNGEITLVCRDEYKHRTRDSVSTKIEEHTLEITDNAFSINIELVGESGTLFSNEFSDKTKRINSDFPWLEETADDKKWKSSATFTFDAALRKNAAKNKTAQSKYIKQIFKRKWRYRNRPLRFILGYNHQLNYSSLLLAPNDFNSSTDAGLETRLENELGSFGQSYSFIGGIARYQHGFIGSYNISTYNVSFQDSASLNYETGLYDNLQESDGLNFQMHGICLYYRYANYFNKYNPYASAGFVVNWLKDKTPVRFIGVSATCSFGLNYKPAHWIEAHVGPTASFFIEPFRGENITSRPFSVGVEAGVAFNISLPTN